jgi:hypothetical protein
VVFDAKAGAWRALTVDGRVTPDSFTRLHMEKMFRNGMIMSGRIQRTLAKIFDSERDNAFTVEDLCERVWPDLYPGQLGSRIRKSHRNIVIRAARDIARQRPEIQWLYGQRLGRTLVFFRHDEVTSYAIARLKADRFQEYRNPRFHWRWDEEALRRKLDDESYGKLISAGGEWRRQVEIFLASRRQT